MARSQNLKLENSFGNMHVVTCNVASREKYLTTVFRGNELWDSETVDNIDDAIYIHARFCEMCKLFAPVLDKMNSKCEADRQDAMNELGVIQAMGHLQFTNVRH